MTKKVKQELRRLSFSVNENVGAYGSVLDLVLEPLASSRLSLELEREGPPYGRLDCLMELS